jgi:hypothetical protein
MPKVPAHGVADNIYLKLKVEHSEIGRDMQKSKYVFIKALESYCFAKLLSSTCSLITQPATEFSVSEHVLQVSLHALATALRLHRFVAIPGRIAIQ